MAKTATKEKEAADGEAAAEAVEPEKPVLIRAKALGGTVEVTCNVKGLLTALSAAKSVCPTRTPKPILQKVLMTVDPDNGTNLLATDLEIGIKIRVLGVKADKAIRLILPPTRLESILRGCEGRSDEIVITASDTGSGPAAEILATSAGGKVAKFNIPLEDDELFPVFPEFPEGGYLEVSSPDVRKLIDRTSFATDPGSTRYALGGCLMEIGGPFGSEPNSLTFIGTDGRRLSKQTVAATLDNGGPPPAKESRVLPLKVQKLLSRVVEDEDPPIHITFDRENAALFRTYTAVIYSRLVQGRYPRYQDVLPDPARYVGTAACAAGEMLYATEQAASMTSTESKGIDMEFNPILGATFKASAADYGNAEVQATLEYSGPEIDVALGSDYILQVLRVLDKAAPVELKMISAKEPCVLYLTDRTEGFLHVIMPLTRDK